MPKSNIKQAAVGQPSMDEAIQNAPSTGPRQSPRQPSPAYAIRSLRLLKISRTVPELIYKIIIWQAFIFK